jgi:hypothetical protein
MEHSDFDPLLVPEAAFAGGVVAMRTDASSPNLKYGGALKADGRANSGAMFRSICDETRRSDLVVSIAEPSSFSDSLAGKNEMAPPSHFERSSLLRVPT